MPILCLGEALVDLICERPVEKLTEADAFVPHFGGAVANAAVGAARRGGSVALAGGAGDDAWGAWLRERLGAEGVALDWFAHVPGWPTPFAFVTVDHHGEPTYALYGEGLAAVVEGVGDRIEAAVEASDALFLASNTLVGEGERAVSLRGRERALRLGRPVVFDPNLRLHRWPSPAAAAGVASGCVPGALLVRLNRDEAALMTGERDPERAAAALLEAGARCVLVTLGPDGAIVRGEHRADAPGVPADVVSAVGAGDALTGVLLAALSREGFAPATVAAALPDAVAEGARATERWGALA